VGLHLIFWLLGVFALLTAAFGVPLPIAWRQFSLTSAGTHGVADSPNFAASLYQRPPPLSCPSH
jgi:hypothetical protein